MKSWYERNQLSCFASFAGFFGWFGSFVLPPINFLLLSVGAWSRPFPSLPLSEQEGDYTPLSWCPSSLGHLTAVKKNTFGVFVSYNTMVFSGGESRGMAVFKELQSQWSWGNGKTEGQKKRDFYPLVKRDDGIHPFVVPLHIFVSIADQAFT